MGLVRPRPPQARAPRVSTVLPHHQHSAFRRGLGLRQKESGFHESRHILLAPSQVAATATSAATAVVQPAVTITNRRPTVVILGVRFTGARVYVRMRICDDQPRNLGILVRETRPGVREGNRRFSTRFAPRPCGAYTRNWLPAPRFRGMVGTRSLSGSETSRA